MKRAFLLLFSLLGFVLNSFGQGRVTLAGSRISIERPENVLISKHTSTIYIDSTIEFMLTELPNVELVKEAMHLDWISPERTEIEEEFELKVVEGKAKVLITRFNSEKDFLQCYMGDSTFGIWASCIYKREGNSIKQRVIDVIQSIRIIDDPKINWFSYLSFSYDLSNSLKIVDEKYAVGVRFTPDGAINDSLFSATNITILQFPPAPSVKSSKDLMMAAISNKLMELTIEEVFYDGEITINDQNVYKFWSRCTKDGKEFELIVVAFYDSKSSIIFDGHIINGAYQNDVYDFVNSIKLKRDGY